MNQKSRLPLNESRLPKFSLALLTNPRTGGRSVAMSLITQGGMGLYHYFKAEGEIDVPPCVGIVQVQTAGQKHVNMSDTCKRSSIKLTFKEIGNSRSECHHCKLKITVRAGSTTNILSIPWCSWRREGKLDLRLLTLVSLVLNQQLLPHPLPSPKL